ncbi:MAG: tetratricopeptide repeat protein [Desulfobacterales bacterium]|jgi:protein O-GlcNAc transferase
MIGKKRPFSYRNRTDLNVNAKSNHQADGSAPPLVVLLEKGLFFHQQGDLQNAAQHYRQILAVSPLNADALHLLGVLSNQKQDNRAAIEYITRALQIIPDHPIYYNNLGNAFRDGGCCQQAVGCYQKALQIKPDLVEAQINLGIAYHQLADFKQAAAAYQKAILLKPDSAEAHYNLGNTFKAQGLFDEAIFCYQQATALNPMLVEAFYNQATILQQKAHPEEAVACLKRCISARPDWAEAHCNLGNVFMQLDLIDDAIVHYQQAIRIKPTLDEAHNNLGNALKSQGKYDQAVACYRKALHIHPVNAEVHSNLGVTYMEANRMAEATRCFQKATRLNPQFAEAHNFMGLTLAEQGRRNEAIDCFKKAIDIKPNFAEALSHLIHQSQHICDWHALKIHSAKLDALQSQTEEGSAFCAEPPFISMARHSDLSQHLMNARAWCSKIVQPLQNLKLPFSLDRRRQEISKLTIGYLSCDFHDHATAHLMQRIFGLHNRETFEIHCYSYGPDDHSSYRKQIQSECDQFTDIRQLSHVDAARRICADKVDILVDLKGHTEGARLGILACRPAPIQVHYLGYPGTIGADFIDYLITDKIVTPIEHAPFYSEKLVFLPHSYQVNDRQQEIASRIPTKQEQGLPDRGWVFSSFNLPYKIDPLMFDCWMRILDQIPGSVLWLFDGGSITAQNLKREARSRGIDPQRLVFAEKLPKAEHLARLKLADLALDTRIVNGHTTTSDSLWAGVPVITLPGDHFASRVSASLLNAVDLPELIVTDLDAYERMAVRLASHPAELQMIKTRLSQNRLAAPLFDTPGFVRRLESAYQKMWRLFREGRSPQQFEVVAN